MERKLKGKLKLCLEKEETLKTPKQKKKREKEEKVFVPEIKLKLIGIGGGGSSIVSEIAEEVKNASFFAADTIQTLKEVNKKVKFFHFGQKLTRGLGTGMNPELGEKAGQEEKERLKEILKETDFCILIASLGGGTGSGASPIFAEISRQLGNLTLGIFFLPFEFEGKRKLEIAKNSLEKLRPNLNASIIIPNERIFQIVDKKTPLKTALSTINKFLADNLSGLIEMIYSSGLINISFADIKTTLEGRGKLLYLNTAEIQKEEQIEELTKKILSTPFYPYSPKEATGILFNIDGGLNLSLGGVEQIGKTISESINPKAKIAFGVTKNSGDKIKLTLLANGCKWEEWEKEKQTSVRKIQEKSKKKAKKIEKRPTELLKVPEPEITQPLPEEVNPVRDLSLNEVKITIRKNALEVKKAIEGEEKKILAQEKKWEIPAFLRRQIEKESESKE